MGMHTLTPVPPSFYDSEDVVALAKGLLGKILVTDFGSLTGGRIIETEAYAGIQDRASHAYGERRTKRNEQLYGKPGTAYVYLCMGIYPLLNAVTAKEGIPHGVLIRAIEVLYGHEVIVKRRQKPEFTHSICGGPGALTIALGINCTHNGLPLDTPPIMICEGGQEISEERIVASPRIGVAYAQEDALLPYRFRLL